VYLREIGTIVVILMVACILAPLVLMVLVADGTFSATQGLLISLGAALLLYLSTQSFMIIWDESPWTKHQNRPMLVGATVLGSAGYSLLALAVGLLIRGG
jgi:hypothetical protein